MKKKILIFIILISLFIGTVKAEDIAPPEEDPVSISENLISENEESITPQEEPKEEKKEETKEETKIEQANKTQKDNYLGIIVLVFLVLLFLMFSFRNQAKNSKEIIKR